MISSSVHAVRGALLPRSRGRHRQSVRARIAQFGSVGAEDILTLAVYVALWASFSVYVTTVLTAR